MYIYRFPPFFDGNCLENRGMVARGVSPDDGDSGAHYTDSALRVPGAGLGPGVLLPHRHGSGDFLLLLSHVSGA